MHTLRISTAQMGKRFKLAKENRAITDITVKSGDKRFAPDWDFLMEYKNSPQSREDEAAYTKKYKLKLKELHQKHPEAFVELLNTPDLILTCYCTPGKFCHRHILKEILFKLGERLGYRVIDGGEIE